jgi:hypothetical protein
VDHFDNAFLISRLVYSYSNLSTLTWTEFFRNDVVCTDISLTFLDKATGPVHMRRDGSRERACSLLRGSLEHFLTSSWT